MRIVQQRTFTAISLIAIAKTPRIQSMEARDTDPPHQCTNRGITHQGHGRQGGIRRGEVIHHHGGTRSDRAGHIRLEECPLRPTTITLRIETTCIFDVLLLAMIVRRHLVEEAEEEQGAEAEAETEAEECHIMHLVAQIMYVLNRTVEEMILIFRSTTIGDREINASLIS
jgi:hypothetical protein